MEPIRDYGHKPSWGLWIKAYVIVWSLFIGIIAIIFGGIQCPFDPIPYRLSPAPLFTGALTPNTKLENAELLFEGDILGPESFVVDKGYIYAALADGRIIQGDLKKRTFVTLKERTCLKDSDTPCSRPLGVRRDKWGHLIIVDSLKGIFTFDPVHRISVPMMQVEDKKHHFFNDLDYLTDGSFVISESTDRFPPDQLIYEFLESRDNGRLWRYDPITNLSSVLVPHLFFPNGVQAHPDQESVLVAESSRFRVIRYYYKGAQNGTLEIFTDNLPGIPDNIRPSRDGGFWVAVSLARKRSFFSLVDFTSMRPWIRSLLGKMLSIPQLHYLTTMKRCVLLKLNSDGQIISSLHDPDGNQVTSCSQAFESDDGFLYVGSVDKNYIARLRI